MNHFFKKLVLCFLIGMTYIPVFAASITQNVSSTSYMEGEEFLVRYTIGTDGKYVNTVDGTITYPHDLLEVQEIRDGNSIINFWVQHPTIDIQGISFSGIIPGGYQGEDAFLFSVLFKAKKTGKGTLAVTNVEMLENDGKASKLLVRSKILTYSIRKNESSVPPTVLFVQESTMPEAFKAEIGQSSDIAHGNYFLTFATQDKGSGISHYEVKEGLFGTYATATSPYVLLNQNLDTKIYVKAVDKDGNERIEVLYPQNWHPWYSNYIISIFIFGLLFYLYKIAEAYLPKRL